MLERPDYLSIIQHLSMFLRGLLAICVSKTHDTESTSISVATVKRVERKVLYYS